MAKDIASFNPQAVPGANGVSRVVASGGPLLGAPEGIPRGGEQDEGDPAKDIHRSIDVHG